MISKDDINGVKIDYEIYLAELLNISEYFMTLSNKEKFERVLEQSHGESDVIANGYELDFKLLVPQEFMNNKLKALPNVNYSHLDRGAIFVNDKPTSTNNLTQEQANRIFFLFVQLLAKAKDEQIESYASDKDSTFYSTTKMIKKEKNLLLFFPCVINISNGISIPFIISKFFSILFSLRNSIKKDTYVVLLASDDHFYILKYENRGFFIVDKVHKIFVPSFNQTYMLTYFLENN
ncbi:MAG: hypothetical protein HDT28_02740 [Clostridiales bacterium]|nr:hypothetical protein [Clostridiales bacterium]